MEHAEELGKLEQFVERMLAGYNELRSDYEGLQSRLQQMEETNKELQGLVDGLKEDRNVMYGRVNGLIEKIEEWEVTSCRSVSAAAGSGQKGKAVDRTMPIFSLAASPKGESAAG